MPLGSLPSARILGNTPGASTSRRWRGGGQPGGGQAPGGQQQQQQQQGPPPGGGQTQTFAQMQQQGLARPAPPQPQAMAYQGSAQPAGPSRMMASQYGAPDVGSQYTQSVSNALNAPSRYDLPQVQQVRDALTGSLQQQFAGDARKLDEQMAQRGLSASSFGGGYQGDLKTAQATALANMNAQLIQGQAATSAGDLAASLGAGAQWQQGQNQANQFQQQFGQSQLENQQQFGLAQGQLTGQYGGQSTLGGAQQKLAEQLGLGNLGVAQGQLGLGQQQLQQQGSQFGQQFGLQQLENQQQYGLSQAQQQLAQQLGLGNLDVSRQQLAQQGQQFGQSLGEQQQARLQQGQQFGQTLGEQQQSRLQQGSQFGQTLAEQLQARLQNQNQFQQTLGQNQSQFQQNLSQQQLENQQQYGIAQGNLTGSFNGQDTLANKQLYQDWSQRVADRNQQLQIAQMDDATNRSVQDAANRNAINQWMTNWLAQQQFPKS